MTTNKNPAPVASKHSNPFYISTSLFHNKRLKQKRCKWAAGARRADSSCHKKTERSRRDYSALKADVTIDLLSDDDDNDNRNQSQRMQSAAAPVIFAPDLLTNTSEQQLHEHQKLIFYQSPVSLSQIPNIKLIPLQKIPMTTFKNRINCKRKTREPKRLSKATIVNNESIVLSDSDSEAPPVQPPSLPTVNESGRTGTGNRNDNEIISRPGVVGPFITEVSQVEEVTVSLVPRTSGGSCSKPSTSELFPMVPDETTVHTVIANRVYELPLNKLREGLVYGDSNDSDRDYLLRKSVKGTVADTAASDREFDQPPISLKLSSDLSISLISDDEDEQNEQPSPEKLLRQQPHLSIQQYHVPVMANDNHHQVPKRRKLG